MMEIQEKSDPTSPVKLAYPFKTAAGKLVEEITLRRATVLDRRKVARQWPDLCDQEPALVARLAGLILEDLDLMDAQDYSVVQARFLGLIYRANEQQPMGGDGTVGEVVSLPTE